MKQVVSLLAVAGLLALAGCGGESESGPNPSTVAFYNALKDLKSGQGVPAAAPYHGGTLPHKIYGYYDSYDLPAEWLANSLPELQLFINRIETRTKTGRTQAYSYLLRNYNYELIHLTHTYTLLEAQTGEVLATLVLEGDNTFPDTITEQGPVFTGSGYLSVDDKVDSSPILEWVRPYVER